MHKDIKEILYTEEEIKAKCDELAKQIDQDYACLLYTSRCV